MLGGRSGQRDGRVGGGDGGGSGGGVGEVGERCGQRARRVSGDGGSRFSRFSWHGRRNALVAFVAFPSPSMNGRSGYGVEFTHISGLNSPAGGGTVSGECDNALCVFGDVIVRGSGKMDGCLVVSVDGKSGVHAGGHLEEVLEQKADGPERLCGIAVVRVGPIAPVGVTGRWGRGNVAEVARVGDGSAKAPGFVGVYDVGDS